MNNDIYVTERRIWIVLAAFILAWPVVRFLLIDFPVFSWQDSFGLVLGPLLLWYHFTFRIGADNSGVYLKMIFRRFHYEWSAINNVEVVGAGGQGRMDRIKKIRIYSNDRMVISISARHTGFAEFSDAFLKRLGENGVKISDK